MEQMDCSTRGEKYKHLNERQRYKLEGYLEAKLKVEEISLSWMNNYPRKILGYKTASELVLEATNNRIGILN